MSNSAYSRRIRRNVGIILAISIVAIGVASWQATAAEPVVIIETLS